MAEQLRLPAMAPNSMSLGCFGLALDADPAVDRYLVIQVEGSKIVCDPSEHYCYLMKPVSNNVQEGFIKLY